MPLKYLLARQGKAVRRKRHQKNNNTEIKKVKQRGGDWERPTSKEKRREETRWGKGEEKECERGTGQSKKIKTADVKSEGMEFKTWRQ